ncbi:hypothetical protein BDFB_003797, partial [Asbolus verrucosus]
WLRSGGGFDAHSDCLAAGEAVISGPSFGPNCIAYTPHHLLSPTAWSFVINNAFITRLSYVCDLPGKLTSGTVSCQFYGIETARERVLTSEATPDCRPRKALRAISPQQPVVS